MNKFILFTILLFLNTQSQADDLGDFINNHLVPKDPTPVALKPIAKLQEAAIAAISFVGKPYLFGGSNPDTGFDCSGLVQYVLDQSGVKKLPRTSREMYDYSSPVDTESLVVGDLLFFQTNNAILFN